jgi:hypothetical protein
MKLKTLLLLCILALTSCQEEEFYEKEYIDTLKDQYERANQTDEDLNDPNNPGYIDPNNGGNDPGSNGGNDPGGNDPGNEVTLKTDSFSQQSSGGKLDILWVIDNSGSMGDEQQALGDNFSAFIEEFVEKNIDFQMAVTTTDTRSQYAGVAYGDSMETLTSEKLAEDQDQFLEDFAENVSVGVDGSGKEKGIKGSFAFTNRHKDDWLRDDAYYVIVYMSDEEDQSEASVNAYMNGIKAKKNNDGLVKAYSIVQMVETSVDKWLHRGYERYQEASDLTNGRVTDIRDDFYLTLLEMGEEIAQLSEQFPLSSTPADIDSIVVVVDGVESQDWEYIPASNTISFNSAPAVGAQIEVTYEI